MVVTWPRGVLEVWPIRKYGERWQVDLEGAQNIVKGSDKVGLNEPRIGSFLELLAIASS